MVFTGNWSNSPTHPPVKACLDSGGGQAVCGCALPTPSGSATLVPTVHFVDAATPLRIPIELKKTCTQGPDTLNPSDMCPVITANGITYWALSYVDNRLAMAVVAYDASGNVVGLIEKAGARYVWDIAVDASNHTLVFKGQGGNTFTVKWTDLILPQMNGATTSNYVVWPTALGGQAWWSNGVANYGAPATFGSASGQLLDPYVEHGAGKQLCAIKQQPWFDFVSSTVTSPSSTVTCMTPPTPGQPTYNAAMNALLDAAVNDHGLMAALRTATTDSLLISLAASRGFTLTSADIAQSRGHGSGFSSGFDAADTLARTAVTDADCGGANQKPCVQCAEEVCVYWPFNFCCIKESCSCSRTTSACATGLQVNANGICQPACPSGQICKDFPIYLEYNDSGTTANGVCESWLGVSNCAKGIPNNALADYEVVFSNGVAYYKTTNTPVHTWTPTSLSETLYVIDARDGRIYMINVDGRYIQIRGAANCVGETKPQDTSTRYCTKPRLTTHAGVLMGSLAGLPSPNPPPGQDARQLINVIGAGTIKLNNGVIQWITNDSGHFKPSQDNLKNSIAHIKRAGFPHFPPYNGCDYNLQPVAGKTGVYRQDTLAGSHCEL
ncbi:hypothetical protein LY474_09100 [Myxococcus stipitatus]|uniref:hypothetical protein n=1 Tax=Myxococcus stipitatus TaxID=83455 RepID=UPI001F32B33B|nr:hypothetical protein [Myxococcus stipitatus]MCE9667966.1 hypothetical protein [Myxococcus stipitatus]